MPLYEYQCPKCGRFELIRKFSDEMVTKCPTCGSDVQKLLSAPAIQFGPWWEEQETRNVAKITRRPFMS